MSYANRIYHAGSRELGVRMDIDLIRELSDCARITRKPGQTLQSRLNELRLERDAGEHPDMATA